MTDAAHMEKIAVVNGQNSSGDEDETVEEEIGGQTQAKKVELELSEVDLNETVENGDAQQEGESPVEEDKIRVEPATISPLPSAGDREKVPVEQEKSSLKMESKPEIVATTPVAEEIETIESLKEKCAKGDMDGHHIVASVSAALVGGVFDLENRFVIRSGDTVLQMVDLLDVCPPKLQAEVWSVFIAIVRKCTKNLEACADVGLITKLLDRLQTADDIVADLFIELLGVLTCYSINVKEMKTFMQALQAKQNIWPKHSTKLLHVLKLMPKKDGPDVFFSFSGNKSAGIALPPIKSWPHQSGWTFSTWFRLDPINSVNFEREKPFLYCFKTSKGLGYSAHFIGNSLVVTSMKVKNKGFQHCFKYEFAPRKWYMVTLAHVYNRWSKSEIRCFVNGQQIDSVEMSWVLSLNEQYDKCHIGCSPEGDSESSFCGQMGSVYCFTEALNVQQINSMYCLGPSYQSQFKYENETNLPDGYKKFLFDGKLSSSLMFAYCPKSCDRQLCLESSPKENLSYFVHTPHALMLQDVKVVVTHSIYSTLHSVGGIQMLLPLFGQLSCAHMKSDGGTFVDYTTCSTLLSVVCQLLELNPNSQQQMFQNKGFLVISHMLQKAEKRHIDESVLDTFLSTAKYLLSSPTGIPLLKQLFDHILFNPGLWIHTAPNIQLKLYSYLANDFLSNHQFYSNIRKVSTILQMIHALKYYYWVTNPEAKSGFTPKGLDGSRPGNHDVVKIRGFLLVFIRKLFLKGDPPKDDELQAILNFLTTVNEDDNLYDFLQSVISLMAEDPASMIPGFDRKQGVCAVYKLLASGNELIRIPALKLLGFFLCRSTAKRKQDTMGPNNLFTLLTDRLILHAAHLSVATYNGLFELLTENVTAELQYCPHPPPEQYYRFENPMILKVIANLISQSKNCDELLEVKKLFINDMIALCSNNSDNRRTILQMSVWQEWLISMAHIFPKNQMEDEISNCVYHLFSILLHHAIKLEYGGWRVWVDTMAIVHSKVSFERFKQDMAKKYNIYEERVSEGETSKRPGSSGLRQSASVDFPRITEKTETLRRASLIDEEVSEEDVVRDIVDSLVDKVSRKFADDLPAKATRTQSTSAKRHRQIFQSEPPRPIYRTPEYKWSDVHIRLLSDLLLAIETDVSAWKGVPHKSLIETVNSSDNTIFVVNAVHMLSQLVDNLVLASGGLLPLLAAATSPNSELEIVDGTQQGLPIDVAVSFLIRFVSLADVLVFASAVNFGELEQEKNMPSGGILRQCLRLVSTVAVRNCLVSREVVKLGGQLGDSKKSEGNKNGKRSVREEAVRLLIRGGMKPEDATSAIMNDNGIPNPDQLLQEMDLSRLKAVIYRDVEETKQAQFLALAVVYFLSVLMVSRYRDILEPPPSPSPFFGTDKGRRESSSAKEESSVTRERRNSNSSSTASTSAMSGDLADSQEKSAAKAAAAQLGGTSEEAEPETNNKVESNGETGGVQEEQNKPERWRVEDEEGSSAEPTPDVPISAINIQQAGPTVDSTAAIEKTKSAAEHQLKAIEPAEVSSSAMAMSSERQASLTSKLRSALDSCAPLLREIMTDFHSFLQRTLLGTHGQEIMNDARVVATLRNQHGSVVELVMLLCSQEWQTSLQKHAGLAFIELVNEGRLLAHATRDHIVRVANEADFILNRLRAEDVTKHADFEAACAQVALNRREEERSCDHLISAARRRDTVVACRVNDKILNLLTSHHGAWTQLEKKEIFWKLDVWEDDSRRRKRLIPNPYGSSHPEATLKAAMEHGGSEQEVEKAREAFLAHLSAKKIFSPSQVPAPQGDEILDESEIGKLMDEKEPEVEISDPTNYSAQCKLIAPGITLPGTISITASEMYFDCNEDDPEFRAQDSKALRYCDNLHGRWHFNEIRAIFLRRFLLENSALEIFLASRTAILLAFPDHATVKKVVQHLPRVGVGVKYGLPQSRRASLMSPRQLFKHSDMPQKWQRREISNFDYLMFLNTVAGRTHSDLNQYPVFPWILANYESKDLDLSQPANYRDLSKPIGALNPSRKAYFEERYASWDHEKVPPFHYGTHYSTAAFVLNWMIRMEPFTTLFLTMQGGKFDHADRTFHSLAQAWKSCQRDTHDVKELIPEFYYLPEMLLNLNAYKFGVQDDGSHVNDVSLPPWAKSAEHFVTIHRQALESELVSCQIHQWIDLIFGYKQRGPEAVRATNVFYYLTYEGAVDLNNMEDSMMRKALEDQIKNFGQTPAQLLTEPHPPRQSMLTISPLVFNPVSEDLCMIMKFISNSPVVHLSPNTFTQLTNPTVVSIGANLGFAINKWNNNYSGPSTTPSFGHGAPEGQQQQQQQNQIPNLPLTVDPLLATGNAAVQVSRRHLGEAFDQRLVVKWNNFVTTVDSKFIFACGYTDYSFRVINTDQAKVSQTVYGHKDVVTCLARSECNIVSDCYLASGSKDCTVLLWHWNAKNQIVAGEYNLPGEIPAPRAVLTGHDNEITCVVVSAEHGIIISSSLDGAVLIHTTQGELLRSLESPDSNFKCPRIVVMSRECHVIVLYDQSDLCLFTTSGRLLKTAKADMAIQCLSLSRDGEYLIAGGGGELGNVAIHRLFELDKIYSFPPCDSPVKSVAVAQNHRFILAGLGSGAIIVFNVDFNKWHHDYENRYTQRSS